MRRIFPAALALMLPLTLPAVAWADEQHASACTAPVAPTGELAPWTEPVPLLASANPQRRAPLALGQAAEVTLVQTSRIRYAKRPEKPGGSVSYGGMIALDVREAGTYRVALGSAVWIDMIGRGQAVTSVAHGHGPACTGVRKMVDFPLTPGRYTLQIAGNGEERVKVLVARLP